MPFVLDFWADLYINNKTHARFHMKTNKFLMECADTTEERCYVPFALMEDNRHPIMLLATLGSVTLA